MRETLLLRAISILKEKGFEVSTFLNVNSCFDIGAKRGNILLLVKVLGNIDAFREAQAEELEKIASLFRANPFIVGEKTKAFQLEKGFFYERQGINAVEIETFREVLENRFPSVKYFKGKKIVELDGEKIRKRRKEMGITVSQLAEIAKTTPETVHRHEKSKSATLETAEKLESILGIGVMKRVNLFRRQWVDEKKIFAEQQDDETFEHLTDLGLKLAVFRHAPFRVFSEKGTSEFLINRALDENAVKKNAIQLAKSKKVFSSTPFILAKQPKKKVVSKIPIISETEMESTEKFDDLLRMIRQREKIQAKKGVQ